MLVLKTAHYICNLLVDKKKMKHTLQNSQSTYGKMNLGSETVQLSWY